MPSMDNSLDLVEKLDTLKKDNIDYFLMTIQAGKVSDSTTVWCNLKNENAPDTLLQSLLRFMEETYPPDVLTEVLCDFLDFINDVEDEDENETSEAVRDALETAKPKKKRNKPVKKK